MHFRRKCISIKTSRRLPAHPHNNFTDRELLMRFQGDHDNAWLGLLLDRYTLLLYGVCMKYLKDPEEARDAVQQIFLKVIVELHKYDVTYFSSWLYMIAKNHCLMKLRNKNHSVPITEDSAPLVGTEEPVDEHELSFRLDQLQAALGSLNAEQKTCVERFYLAKKSYQEIADETGFSLLQVKSYIQNGKRNLRLIMERNNKKS